MTGRQPRLSKEEHAVLGTATLTFEADDYTLFDLRVILDKMPKPPQMIGRNLGRGLCLDSELRSVTNASAGLS